MSEINEFNWKNADNINFYEHVPVEVLQRFVSIGGFEDNCDLNLIYPIIKDVSSVIEIGAGYGRIINFLLKQKYKGSITAVERSEQLYKYLLDSYDEKINLIHADIEKLSFENEFDAVLFLWSGISEWPQQEQLNIIEKLFSWVAPNGYLILELFDPSQVPLNSTACEQQFYQYESEYGTAVGRTPNQYEMQKHISLLHAQSINIIPYKTTTDRKRILYIIRK